MNIFLLHENPREASTALCDTHTGKMCLEAVQIANTGLHLAGASEYAFYNPTHKNHPWCEFASQSFDHFFFVVAHAQALGEEFYHRYDDRHTSHLKMDENWTHDDLVAIEEILGRSDEIWPDVPQAMPDIYHSDDPVEAYRDYYYNDKWSQDWCVYRQRNPPEWFAQARARWSKV